MNVLRGKVVLKETSVGIPGLIVVVEDVHAALPAGVIAAPAPAAVGAGAVAGDGGTPPATDPAAPQKTSIGSRVTGADGSFEVEYEDAELQAAGAAPARPFLLLSVLAPAEARSTLEARTLCSSQDSRPAGLTEERLIAISAATLTSAGVPVPPDPSLATEPEQAQAVVETMKQAPEYRAALTGQARTLAAQLVKGARGRPLAVLGLWSGGPKPTAPTRPACRCAGRALKTSTSH